MPENSERQTLLNQLDSIFKRLAVDGNDDTAEFYELIELKAEISIITRYLNLRIHLEKNRSMRNIML